MYSIRSCRCQHEKRERMTMTEGRRNYDLNRESDIGDRTAVRTSSIQMPTVSTVDSALDRFIMCGHRVP